LDPIPSSIVKTYPPRGPLQQFRLAEGFAFRCFRCGQTKKSKLVTIYNGDWQRRVCNGCYGRLLSLYQTPAGMSADDERVDELAAALLAALSLEEAREAERLYRAAESRAQTLSPAALQFVASAEYVSSGLQAAPQLDWSGAVICLSKAVEVELISRFLEPLRRETQGMDLSADVDDKDLKTVARYCAGRTDRSPEIGSLNHFLLTAISSSRRRGTSPTVRAFLHLASEWSGSSWVLDRAGLHSALDALTTQFRNPAAHTDCLDRYDYQACRDVVVGQGGVLWRLAIAVQPHTKSRPTSDTSRA